METLLLQLFTGLSIGSVLLLAALGLSLIFGQMGVINMAHGELIMAGAYTAYVTQQIFADVGLALIVALPAGFFVGGLIGVAIEALLLRRMYHRPLDTLLVTFGLSLILQQVARDLFGAPNKQVRAPSWLSGSLNVGGLELPLTRVFILGVSLACTLAVAAVLLRTSLGRGLRATVQNRALAETTGVSTRATDRATFFLGSGLAGIAGVCITLIGSTGPTMGTTYLIDAFLVVVVGGLANIKGAVLAAFAMGLAQSAFEYTTSASIGRVLLLLAVVIFLQARPQGLFAVRTRSLA